MTDLPLFEAENFDPASVPDAKTRRFAEGLRRDGLATIDLGDDARALCDRVLDETRGYFEDGETKRVQDAWRRSPAVRQMACLPEVLAKLAAVYGRKPFPFQTLNFEVGTEQKLHSDMIHFSSLPERFMCGVWVALEDVEADAGPLAYVRGSHRLRTLYMTDAGVAGRPSEADYPKFEAALADEIATSNLEQQLAVPRKGEAVVWAANLAHGGSPIARAGATRRSMVTHYYFDGCVYFTPMLSDMRRGRLYVRAPADIARGGLPRLSSRNGWPVLPSPTEAINGLARLVMRLPYARNH